MAPDLDHWKRSIKRLEDRFGQYTLVLSCSCGHKRYAKPEALAKIAGWTIEIAELVPRLRCSQCGKKGPAWDVERVPRPRGR